MNLYTIGQEVAVVSPNRGDQQKRKRKHQEREPAWHGNILWIERKLRTNRKGRVEAPPHSVATGPSPRHRLPLEDRLHTPRECKFASLCATRLVWSIITAELPRADAG